MKTKVTLVITSLFLLLVLLISIVQLYYVKAEMKTVLAEQQHGFVARVAEEFDQKLLVYLDFVDAGTRTIPPEYIEDLDSLEKWGASRQGLRAIFSDIIVISAKGVVLIDEPPRGRHGIDVSDQEYFRTTVETRKPYISKPFLGRVTKEPIVAFSAPVIDKHGVIIAVLSGSLNLLRPNFLGNLSESKVGNGGSFEVFARDRTIVISPDKGRILTQGPALGVSSYFEHAISGLEGSEEDVDSRGDRAIFSYSPLKAAPWVLVASLPVGEAYAPIQTTQRPIIRFTLLLALLVAALAWFGVRRLFDPLQAALGASERLYSALFANKSNAIAHCKVITDEHGRPVDYWILQVNEAYERIIGIKRADIEGRRVKEVFPGVEQYAFDYIGALGKVALEGGEITSETFFEATQQYLSIYAYSPLPGEFTAIFTDITERKYAETALRESEERYRNLFNTMDEGFCIIEMIFDAAGRPVDYRFLETNAAFAKQTGLHEAKGKLMRELAPAHEAHWFEIYGNIALTGKSARFMNEARALNRWYDVYAYRVGRPEDRQVAIIFNDISERKRAEEGLRESEERLRAMANAMPQLGWIARPDGYIFWYNDRWYEYTGTTPEQMEGWGWQSVHDAIELPKVLECWKASIATGKPFEMTFPLRGADGGFRQFLTRGFPLKDAAGCVVQWFGTNTDVEELTRAEKAKRESEERLRFALESCHIGAWDIDLVDHTAYRSLEHDRIFGYAELLPQWTLDDFLKHALPEYRADVEAMIRDATAAQTGWTYECPIRRVDGEIRWIWFTGSHRTDSLGRGRVAGVVQDITERKQSEQALVTLNETLESRVAERTTDLAAARDAADEANRTKSQFLAHMSHELRTPLNAILGFSRLVRNARGVPVEQIKNLDIINRSGEHLLNLINNVLDISRIESAQAALKEISTDLNQLLQEVQSLMQARAAEKGLTFAAPHAPTLHQRVIVDADKLRQVLINLVGNAIKFTQHGSVVLRARVTRQDSPQQAWVRFEVEDSGPGISAEDRERIFLPFVQLGEQPRAEAGTGLGLIISKQYVELMGGQIDVASEPGKGSVFHFEIPVRITSRSEDSAVNAQRGRVAGLALGQQTYRLLIAEDQVENRLLLRKLLEPLGFELREAADGQEAVALFEQWRPHLIWMDIGLPKIDGLQAARCIRASEHGANIKIVAVTAHVFEDERNNILEAGCNDFIRKPYRETEIFEALERNLGVRFLYEKRQPSIAAAEERVVDVAQLERLSPSLLEALRQAAVELDGPRCLEIAEGIDAVDHELRGRLQRMVIDLQYAELLQILDHAIAMRPA